MATFHLKRLDTRPVLEVTLLNPDGTVHDLTGATAAHLHMTVGSTTISRDMVIDAVPTTGIVRYTFLDTDWSGTPGLAMGLHRMEYEVLGAAGARLTFPNDSYDILSIISDLGQGV